jgi:hypothetical protein
MRGDINKHRIKNETPDVENEVFDTDKKGNITEIEEQLEVFADIIVAFLIKENYNHENG